MKTYHNILSFSFIASILLFFSSCEEPDITSSKMANNDVITNNAEMMQACSHSHGYYKNHDFECNGLTPDFDFYGLGTVKGVLQAPPRGNADIILAKQYITATLNACLGAPLPDEAGLALATATAYFEAKYVLGGGETLTRAELLEVKDVLEAYNLGEIEGSVSCD